MRSLHSHPFAKFCIGGYDDGVIPVIYHHTGLGTRRLFDVLHGAVIDLHLRVVFACGLVGADGGGLLNGAHRNIV